ncbi:hypothetical protein BH11MYX3_BH11MYX3_47560 [soil metagenome]
MPLTALVTRTYLRYLVPVTLLSALAFAPLLWLVMRVPVPADLLQARGVLRTTWLLVGLSLVPLLILVGGVSPSVRSIAEGRPVSQLAAVRDGVLALSRAVLPCGVAVIAVAVGSLALVIPGLLLLVLLSLTGATAGPGQALHESLSASVTAVRARFVTVASILLLSIAVTCGAVYFLQRGLPVPLPKQPPGELLPNVRVFARWAIAGLAIGAPLPAIALAALATRSPSART